MIDVCVCVVVVVRFCAAVRLWSILICTTLSRSALLSWRCFLSCFPRRAQHADAGTGRQHHDCECFLLGRRRERVLRSGREPRVRACVRACNAFFFFGERDSRSAHARRRSLCVCEMTRAQRGVLLDVKRRRQVVESASQRRRHCLDADASEARQCRHRSRVWKGELVALLRA